MCIAITFETGEPLQQRDITLNTYTVYTYTYDHLTIQVLLWC